MESAVLQSCSAMRWDTYNNKVYFNLDRDTLKGRLILRKGADGKIDMQLVSFQDSVPAAAVLK